MPELKIRRIFISHAWTYSTHYETLVNWFNEEPNFSWANYSIPNDDCCTEKTKSGLQTCITNQMKPAQGIILFAGMYANHSDWIDYEIEEAIRMEKIIIAVKPWGQERMPIKIQNAAHTIVNWNSASIISIVRSWI
jgi:hypothetical protein